MHSEAALARLCRAAPILASSGRVRRHRLHRGGDRGANHALRTTALCGMRYDHRTLHGTLPLATVRPVVGSVGSSAGVTATAGSIPIVAAMRAPSALLSVACKQLGLVPGVRSPTFGASAAKIPIS
ncbi:transposase [Micromonospora sp. IBHARD004]|uniref:transposase n=1 Tax=Micromonospora sp. IBHARD004 TaxID=3457764 RepID=UPI004058D005